MMQGLFDLTGRVVVVIGGASGIGEAVVEGCVQSGAGVVCLDIDMEAARAVADKLGDRVEAGQLDIRDGGEVRRTLDRIASEKGRLDGAVCTPGVNVRKPILDYSPEEFDKVVGLNLKGTFHVLQAVGHIMHRQGSGSIVTFSSIRSVTVEPGQGVYASTKAGVVQLTRTLAAELGDQGVRVNAIAPGVVDTPLTHPIQNNPEWYQAYSAKSILNRWASPGEMAGPAVFLLSDAATYVTGSVLFVDGGWTAVDGRFDPPM